MSLSATPSSNSSKTELEIVVNWRMVAVGAALAALLISVPAVGFLCFAGHKTEPATRPVATEPRRALAVTPRDESHRFRFDPASVAALAPPSPPPVEVPERVPMPSVNRDPIAVDKPSRIARVEPSEPAPVRETTHPRTFRSLAPSYGGEHELQRQLRECAREFYFSEFDKKPLLVAAKPSAATTKDGKVEKPSILDLAAENPELKGLPLRQAKDCTKTKEAARKMQTVSLAWRKERVPERSNPSIDPGVDMMNDLAFAKMMADEGCKYGIEELTTLVQMFQTKGYPVRLQLVKMLDSCKDARASALLAERALFDFNEEVRVAAILALKKRPSADFRATLLAGFRHPWPTVARHAAEALTALQDLNAVPKLAALLDDPDPAAPCCENDGKWTIREVVRINHLRNCVVCHAPSSNEKDPLRGPIPSPGQKLPVVYYESIRGPAVRADVTYLRQDFSLLEPVADAGPWPILQRFDYVVRKRELTDDEVKERFSRGPEERALDYPQRLAVLFALRELTGEDAGTSSEAWRLLLRRIGLSDS
jgi:hypothetical protein